MSTFANQLKLEISRLAKKEVRAASQSFKKASAQFRGDISALKKRVSALESQLKKQAKGRVLADSSVSDDEESSRSLLFRVDGFAALRKKLGLNATEMAKLLGVSAQSVYHWETGKSKPRASQLQAIAVVRKMGKRAVIAKLTEGQ